MPPTRFYEAPQPRSYFNSSTGYGTLGYGLPAAIGAKLGAPHRPVVCLIGDGGLQFSLPELASAVEAQVPVAVVIWNNTGYGEIKAYHGRTRHPADRRRHLHAGFRRASRRGSAATASRPAASPHCAASWRNRRSATCRR